MTDRNGSLRVIMIAMLILVPPAFTQQPVVKEGYFESFDGRGIYWQSWRVESPSVIVLIHGYDGSSDTFLKLRGI